MNTDKVAAQLLIDEGKRFRLYKDTEGKWTIGIGRNLDDVGISEDELQLMLKNDIKKAEAQLDALLPWWRQMNEARQDVLANMCFNMGINRLMGFKNTLTAMQAGKFEEAATGMMASKWATQVGDRAARLAAIMKYGVETK